MTTANVRTSTEVVEGDRTMETPEELERTAEELVRLATEHGRDLSVAGDLVDLAEKYMQRAKELRARVDQAPKREPPTREADGQGKARAH
jgi:hypothetical protein